MNTQTQEQCQICYRRDCVHKRTIKVHVNRTAMIGGGLSYDVEVPVSSVPNYDGCRYTTISRSTWDETTGKYKNHRDYVNFTDATLPESHFAMPQGWDRYEHFLAHERATRRRMLDIAESLFPELAKYRAAGHDSLPLLWCVNLLPEGEKETSAEFTIEVKL